MRTSPVTVKSASDTKTQILDAAEELFAEFGYAGTTLRAVVRSAGVNIAAVHYHFGSKEELFRAATARLAGPIVAGQLERLAAIPEETPTVEAILTAFLAPPLELIGDNSASLKCAQFFGRGRSETAPVQQIAKQEFRESETNFLNALERALPYCSRAELTWKLDLVIAALIRTLTEAFQPHGLLQDRSPESVETAIAALVAFLAPGMRS